MKISIVLQTYPNENVALQFKLYTLQNLYFKLCRVDCTGRTIFFQKLSIKTNPERYSSLSYHLYIKKDLLDKYYPALKHTLLYPIYRSKAYPMQY